MSSADLSRVEIDWEVLRSEHGGGRGRLGPERTLLKLSVPKDVALQFAEELSEVFREARISQGAEPTGTALEVRWDISQRPGSSKTWTLYWKSRESDDRALLAHPEVEAWVATLALTAPTGMRLVNALRERGAQNGNIPDFLLSDLGQIHELSNLDIRVKVIQAMAATGQSSSDSIGEAQQ